MLSDHIKMKILFLAFLILTSPAFVTAQLKTIAPPTVKTPYNESLQSIVVTTKNVESIKGSAQIFERKSNNAKWKSAGKSFSVVVGRNGLAWSEDLIIIDNPLQYKREGDGRSPSGLFPLTFAFGSKAKNADAKLPFTLLDENTECVDDVNSFHYNKVVGRLQVGIFDWKSSEKMLEIGEQYELGVFVAYNSYPVVKGNGSCIFLHIWKNAETGTAGCTAMEKGDLERIINWLDPKKNPYLIQMPETIYSSYQKKWNLPKLR